MSGDVVQQLAPYVERWGYLAIFIATFLENMGFPVPGEILIVIGGTFALHGKTFLPFVVAIGAAGAVAGDSVIFFIGRFGGRKAIARIRNWLSIDRRTLERIDSFYHRHGAYAVTFSRFIAGGRFTVAITSGASGILSWEQYAFFDYLGALVWALAFGIIGYYFADQVSEILSLVTQSSIVLGIVLLVITIGYALIRYWKQRGK